MFTFIINFIKDFFHSFYNNEKGFSARKASAFAGVFLCIKITLDHTTDGNLNEVLQVWLLFSLLCLGLITFAQIASFRTGKTSIEKTTTETSKSETSNG